jgi:hypothetical protein
MSKDPQDDEATGETSDNDDDFPEYAKVTSINSEPVGFFQRLYRSNGDFDFYTLIFMERGKQAFFYCLKLSLLIGLIAGLVFGFSNWSVVDKVSNQLQQQIPEVTISNGDVNVNAETPYRMTLLEDHEIILDPDAELNRLQLEPNVLMVLVDGAIYVRSNEDNFNAWMLETYTSDGPGSSFVLNATTVQNWTSFFKWMLLVASCIGLMIGYLVQGLIRVVLISVGGFFALDSDSPFFGWRRFLKISCYAVTPVLLADATFFVLGINFPYREWLLLGGGTIFVYFIVKHLEDHLKGIQLDLSGDQDSESESKESSDSSFDF